jgi:ABC-type multidrug transport system fused ATPase/permease subunit
MFTNFSEYKKPMQFIMNSFKWHKSVIYLFIAGKILEAIFYIWFPILAKLEMDQLVDKNEELFGLITLEPFRIFLLILVMIFLMKMLENILRSFLELFEFKYVKILEDMYLLQLYTRLKNIEMWLYLNNRNKRLFSNVLWSSYEIRNLLTNFLWWIISNFITFVWILIVISFFNIYIFLILIFTSIIIYFLNKYKEVFHLKHEISENYEFEYKLESLKNEVAENLHVLSANSGMPLLLSHLEENNKNNREMLFDLQKRDTTISVISFWIENIAEILLKVIIWFAIFSWTESIWFMTMALLYVSRLDGVFSYLRDFKINFHRQQDMLKKLDLFLQFTEKKEKKSWIMWRIQSIFIKNLRFTYPNVSEKELKYFEILEKRILRYKWKRDSYDEDSLFMIQEARSQLKVKNPEILSDINMELLPWNVYGIVWRNGAWKTTLIQLLLGYFETFQWELLLEGSNIVDYPYDEISKNISVVNQIPYVLTNFTVKENLFLWVEKEYTQEYIDALLEKFWLWKKIKNLRLWLDSKIWYDSDFSWWEKQLIVLIRNILQDKPILIMDEWTNQLDAENEMLVMEELLKNKANKIIIFITHRMTSIRKADKIFCLEDWKIINQWTHTELLSWENIYKSFWKKQVVN